MMLGASQQMRFLDFLMAKGIERPQKMTETTIVTTIVRRCVWVVAAIVKSWPTLLQGVSSGDQPAFGGGCTVPW